MAVATPAATSSASRSCGASSEDKTSGRAARSVTITSSPSRTVDVAINPFFNSQFDLGPHP